MDLLQDILNNTFKDVPPQRECLVKQKPRNQDVPKSPVDNLKIVVNTIVETETPAIPTNIKSPSYDLKLPVAPKETTALLTVPKTPGEVRSYQIPKIKLPTPANVEVQRKEVHGRAYKIPTFHFKLPNRSILKREKGKEQSPLISSVYSNNKLPQFNFSEKKENKIKLQSVTYNTPTRSDLAVLFVFFDYTGSARILINYLYMIEKMKLANIPVFTMELVIHGKRPQISDAFHVYASSYLFQKEHLMRLLEKKVPDTFTKLVCLDADLIYTNPDWYDMLSETLDTCNVVQPFSYAHWLDITYKNIEKSALACTYLKDKKRDFWANQSQEYHPGFGWAFTRKWYQTSGFYDLSIVGCGDSIFAYTISKLDFITEKIKLYRKTRDDWATKISDITLGFLEVEIYHLFHGPLAKRQYISRDEPFEHIEDVSSIIEYNEDGVIELTKPELNQAMFDMWMRRDDDGI
uniref:Nucleotide-diphospho-sugar transferase domain-containing protein n=1 Tax=viral metagenome TaxID=1070528 RepID=A0A6C0B1A7_9ZZZZ